MEKFYQMQVEEGGIVGPEGPGWPRISPMVLLLFPPLFPLYFALFVPSISLYFPSISPSISLICTPLCSILLKFPFICQVPVAVREHFLDDLAQPATGDGGG